MTTGIADQRISSSTRGSVLIAGWAAILWGVLSVARAPFTGETDMPLWTAPPADIVAFYEGQDFDTGFMAGIAMAAVGWSLLMVFLAKVSSILEERFNWIGYLIVGGGAVGVAGAGFYLTAVGAGVFLASNGGLGADGYRVLNGLTWSFLWVDLILGALWFVPLAIVIVLTRLFPRWLGWVMVANSVAGFAAFFLSLEASVVTGGLPYLWVLIAGVVMLLRADRYAKSASADPDPT